MIIRPREYKKGKADSFDIEINWMVRSYRKLKRFWYEYYSLFRPIYNQELSWILFITGNNEVISDKRLQHQLKFTNGSPDVVNEMFKEIRSATASASDSNRSQLPNKVSNETSHPKQR